MRLIDADALSERLCKTTIFIKDGEVFQRMINDAPTVSAEARPTGEWEVAYLDHVSFGKRPKTLFCSNCNWLTPFASAWCPNCGADMRGGK